ncbi:histidine kinase [Arthrobacter sp. MYb23]|uniref:sensor histidine kinase n=1 Tax=unclassified Arthrobacter TaxID=235627 RepID=UPI000CFDD2E3|nr:MULTISPECIES: ATP-binding protein [unclassified Arthrobacter]PRB45152.1 histidine kinase [Arthrobacter sp. MYb51]PRB99385.1 histidine kinase [Arthrobacter sp. MYb23]
MAGPEANSNGDDGVLLRLPPVRGIGAGRVITGLVLAVLLPPGIELMVTVLGFRNFAMIMLLQLAVAVAVAAIGGLWPAVVAAVLGSFLLNYFSADPVGSLSIADPTTLFTLVVFLAVACGVALAVGLASRRAQEAARSGAEATALSELALRILSSDGSLETFLEKVRGNLGMEAVTLLGSPPEGSSARGAAGASPEWRVLAGAGPNPPVTHAAADHAAVVDPHYTLLLRGGPLSAHQHRMLAAFGAFVVAVRDRQQLVESRRDNVRLAEGNKMRTSILRAVSHDLRTPLAGIKLAVSSLRQEDVHFPPDVERELLETIEEYADRLDHLVDNLLDMSRITADAVNPLLTGIVWAEVLPQALRGVSRERLRNELPPNLPPVQADAGMLERVVANIVENAVKYAPDSDVVLTARAGEGITLGDRPASELRIIDHGRGVGHREVVDIFQPFQRFGDSSSPSPSPGGGISAGGGIGLGLAVAKGFSEAMGGRLAAEPTPGGGLTMVVTLPLWTGGAQ